MFVAVSIYGVDETPVNTILTEPGEVVGLTDLYEGHAYVMLCATREQAEAFLARFTDDDEGDD